MTAGLTDFDFFHGQWQVKHRRLVGRLAGSVEWQEFDGSCHCRPVLGGDGNVDDNLVNLPGGAYRAVTIRSYDRARGLWSIWWLDGRDPHHLDVPVVGVFKDGQGVFLAEDVLDGRSIRVRFRWSMEETGLPRWEQAFSPDGGATWEVNWSMEFHRMAG
jgi:hypothetical protein